MSLAIETHDLCRTFPTTNALSDLTIDVRKGEVLALLGPNGAGKTTTIRLLNGVLTPDSGTASVCGFDPATCGDAVRARTGVLTEQAGLDERLTARENLIVTARLRKLGGEAEARVDQLLDRFGMAPRRHDLVRGFSTGQRKRVALARALLHEPEVLFLDEPTSGLDPEAIRDVLNLIGELASEGRTIVLCTHFLAEADKLADRMAVLLSGRLHAFGSATELAATLWRGITVEIEVDPDQHALAVAALTATDGVIAVLPHGSRIDIRIDDARATARVVRALAHHEIAIYAVIPRPATLEDVYFAVMAKAAA